MKKTLLFLCVAFAFSSCGSMVSVPLKGNYVEKPIEITSSKSYDQVWSNVIDLFATKGLSVKLIDKSSGLIVSEKTSLMNNYSFETENGGLVNPDAYIVLDKHSISGYKQLSPGSVTAEWNVRIKAIDNNSTIINVNLTNINAILNIPGNQYAAASVVTFTGKSTGNFEKLIAEIVK
jgi:hypothetical protein